MRRALLVSCAGLAACGIFGSTGDATTPPAPTGPPADPAPNEVPTGVFVRASSPDPAADGTAEHPFGSLAVAIEKAGTRRIIVCAEEYAEQVVLKDGVSMFGFYDCSRVPWTRGTRNARITSLRSPTVRAASLAEDVRMSGFDIVAPDFSRKISTPEATWEDESSVALFVVDSPKLVIANGSIVAGGGAAGAKGVKRALWGEKDVLPNTGGNQGKTTDPLSGAGGGGGVKSCVDGIEIAAPGAGGSGGNGAEQNATAAMGHTGVGTTGGAGGVGAAGPGVGVDGTAGTQPPKQRDGKAGKMRLIAAGPARGDGEQGPQGTAGSGGGGGGGQTACHFSPTTSDSCGGTSIPAGGGGGGGGGCPGRGATGGLGGGSSIAVYVPSGTLRLEQIAVKTGAAGAGGEGEDPVPPTDGQFGQKGGCAGPSSVLTGCFSGYGVAGSGGKGSPGGEAGRSGAGAPGVSVGIVTAAGVTLAVEGCTFAIAPPTAGGASQERATIE